MLLTFALAERQVHYQHYRDRLSLRVNIYLNYFNELWHNVTLEFLEAHQLVLRQQLSAMLFDQASG
jgi:hypothetical protein